ncbi:hypothetical protein BC830DRAFT_1105984 [Chytriomyces sp. MP71]|nr:hypothetical protein BC830DRAFT_1105984 [Chytriomyces sp. MP71]
MDASNYFQAVAGGIAIYNSVETFYLIFQTFKVYRTLYFFSIVSASLGNILFAIGFLDLFFHLYVENSSIYRPLIVLTIGWYGMVTGFAIVMYSRLGLIHTPPRIISYIRYFIIYNIFFSHIPTTIFTFGANLIKTDFWVSGYSIIEKIQMTMFTIQETILSVTYFYFIKLRYGDAMPQVILHTFSANLIVLCLDVSMLAVEYVNLYGYQIMLKVLVYSIKLKFEFYIIAVLTEANASWIPPKSSLSRDNKGSILMDQDVTHKSLNRNSKVAPQRKMSDYHGLPPVPSTLEEV